MTKSKHVYREGDRVRIVNSRFVRRVGYALHPNDIRDEMEASAKFKAMLAAGSFDRLNHGRAYRKLLDAVCFAEVALRGMGGRERMIHYFETMPEDDIFSDGKADCTGRVMTVRSKRVVRTGEYFAPCGGQDYYGEWDYDPGGLANMKAHVLLDVGYGEIETCDVEPVGAEE